MRKIFFALALLCIYSFSFSQTIIDRDAEIASMVKEVSADSLQSYIKTMVAFGTRHTLSTQTETTRGIGAARNWVLQKFNSFAKTSNGRLTAFIDTITYKPDGKRVDVPIILGNVMAVLKGTDTSDHRIFLVSGHLDSRRSKEMDRDNDSPGANDDGSGSAAVIECARVMSKHAFPATIIFVCVSGEEQGLLGAYFLANKAKKENWNIEAVLNNDIMGSNNSSETNIIDNTRIRVFSEGLPLYETEKNAKYIRSLGLENDGKARQLARYVKEIGERYVENIEVVMIYRNDRFLRGGDHLAFVENGFAAVRITEMNENYYHQHQDVRKENNIQYGDLGEFMDFEYLRKNTAVNVANLANLAKAPSMPAEVKVQTKNLENYTSLFWKVPKNGKPKGYYILMRETTSAFWQKKFFTTETSIKLPYSKDNYFFAVQSVSESGNESLAVVPSVAR
ncbi:bacterial leucyl aminopeptidase precursor [mine drainage metagenome]|uniref:Bacterial leucyl aminopeptidase n=1 Tax=mine drainage metagenome TaxID=410659 RepID=A0A1J5RYL4_9ZZZZ